MNVLIVDDQRVVLEGLREIVNWQSLDVKKLILVESAQKAKKIIANEEIDILITDIEMPVEDGFQLASWLNSNYPDIPCIFLTAFESFSYAKQAIKHGGFDYILQPAKTEEIERVILRCITHIKQQRNLQELAQKGGNYDDMYEKVLKNLVFSLFADVKEKSIIETEWIKEVSKTNVYTLFLPILVCTDAANVDVIEAEFFKKFSAHAMVICSQLKSPDYATCGIIMCLKEPMCTTLLLQYCNEIFSSLFNKPTAKVMIYIGKEVENSISEITQTLLSNKDNNVTLKNGVFGLKENNITSNLHQPNIEEWKKYLLCGDGELIKTEIAAFINHAESENQLSKEYLKILLEAFNETWIVCCYLKKINNKDFFKTEAEYENFQNAYTNTSKLNFAISFIVDKFNEITENAPKELESVLIQQRIETIKQYINDNLDKNINRSEAAAMAYLSEDYFTKIFKSLTGYGFKEYIINQKIEYCKMLLVKTNFPVGVISSKVGYDNYSNFTQIFKKHTGITPQEYRKNALE